MPEAGSKARLDGDGAGCHDISSVRAARRRGGVSLDIPSHRTLTTIRQLNGLMHIERSDSSYSIHQGRMYKRDLDLPLFGYCVR
jgi:hypothetical protein